MGQHGHGKQLQLVHAQGEAEQPGAVHLHGELLGGALAQLQHNVDGLQAGGVGLAPGQVDKAAVHMEITQTGTQLPQHGGHMLLPDRKARALEFAPHQGVELVASDPA